ncbi:hypothetical protein [Patulibacter americanus]|uniref:hypothetical protein n=1 Tax=Patulibacter americanus TaxID=588672 RepID=UPI0003B58BBF|nr:hypothetical protein [Patulibacter americanus]
MGPGFGRRKDDEPPPPFGGNTRGMRGVQPTADPFASRPGGVAAAPGPDARVVGRPRVVALVGWILMVAIGVGVALTGGTGAVIFGVVWTVGLGGLFLALLRSRVVVDGHDLYFRTVRGWGEPVDLSHLRSATVLTGGNLAQWVLLTDRGGQQARIDAVNLRLKPLYRELAIYIGPWQDIADERLERRIARHR